MQIILNRRILLLGLLSWAAPFFLSFLFFGPDGLTIPRMLFKSIMVVTGGGIGVGLLILAFRRVEASIQTGLTIGVCWLVLNLALDMLVLVPMSGMPWSEYFIDIGMRYLLLPIIAVGMGAVAQRAS